MIPDRHAWCLLPSKGGFPHLACAFSISHQPFFLANTLSPNEPTSGGEGGTSCNDWNQTEPGRCGTEGTSELLREH